MGTAIYARLSRDRFDDHQGVDRQLEDCRRLVEGQPVRVFEDNSKSAYQRGTKRPGYEALLEAVRSGEVDTIICWHIDRLYRQLRELLDLIDFAEKGRVRVLTVVGGDLDLSSPSGAMQAVNLVNYATFESRHKSERVKRKQQQNREKGLPSGGRRAFGWKDSMTPNPVEAQAILDAVDAVFTGASLKDLARRWNAKGLQRSQKPGAPWSADTIRLVLSNPRHAGLLAHDPKRGSRSYERTIVGDAAWPAIIPRQRWEELMAFLDSRSQTTGMPRRRSLLTSLVVCGRCGTTMVRSKGGAMYFYRCPSPRPEQATKSCGGVSVNAAFLEEFLTEATFRRLDSERLAKLVHDQAKDQQKSALIVGSLSELERRLDAAATMFAKGKLSARAFQTASATIEAEQAELRRQLGHARGLSVLTAYVGRQGVLRAAWPMLSLDQRREIIRAALGRVEVMPTAMRGRHVFDPSRIRVAAPS